MTSIRSKADGVLAGFRARSALGSAESCPVCGRPLFAASHLRGNRVCRNGHYWPDEIAPGIGKAESAGNEAVLCHTTSLSGAESILTHWEVRPKNGDAFVSFSEVPVTSDISGGDVTLEVRRGSVEPHLEKVGYDADWAERHEEQASYVAGEGWREQYTVPDHLYEPPDDWDGDPSDWEPDSENEDAAYRDAELEAFLQKSGEREWISKQPGKAVPLRPEDIVRMIVHTATAAEELRDVLGSVNQTRFVPVVTARDGRLERLLAGADARTLIEAGENTFLTPEEAAAAAGDPKYAALADIALRVGDDFEEYAKDAYEEDWPGGLSWRDRLDLVNEWTESEHACGVRDDGLVHFWRATPEVEKLVGNLPVVVYHHTSSRLDGKIRKFGLLPVGSSGVKMVNPHQNSGAGVYVTTANSGPAVSGYHHHAVRVRKGNPRTWVVRTTLADLQPDPDDEDLGYSAAGQFVLPHVNPENLVEAL